MKIQNPILKGFHPDPCICKAKDTYYLITSTFEWLPGISLYSSKDLVNWKSMGGILSDLSLEGIPDSAGIWAPALTYDNGRFYLIYTICRQIDGIFKDVENYVITAENIEGPWSEPVFINASGFDPSMYHENGHHYVINPQWDHRPVNGHRKFNGLILQEFDMERGMVGEAKVVYEGSGWGAAEGPHLMKRGEYYYILSAEGGTGRHHSVCTARSKNLWGPYEPAPQNPMITSWEQDTPLKRSGHGNLVETDDGEWYLVHLCGRYLPDRNVCVLGRETAIENIEWVDKWPQLSGGGCVPKTEIVAPKNAKAKLTENPSYTIDFEKQQPDGRGLEKEEWLSLRTPLQEKITYSKEGLHIKGGASLTSTFGQKLIAKRLQSFSAKISTVLSFDPYHYSQTAGLTCFYNTKAFYYLYVGYDEKRNTRTVNVLSNHNGEFTEILGDDGIIIPNGIDRIELSLRIHDSKIACTCSWNDEDEIVVCENLDLSILGDETVSGWAYTGAVAGITAVDNFNRDTEAVFHYFSIENKEI